jgi:hypothetical protein
MTWHNRPAARGGMIENEMAAGSVIENETVLFKEADDLARPYRWQLCHGDQRLRVI